MPDYKRLVSYIYNYEDGKKKNNVGYARVEARNGQCKCTLHIAAPSLNDKQLKTYMFTRKDGRVNGILLGTLQIKNGIGEYRVQTESEHIMNTPYGLDDIGGIVIYASNSKFFATEWDDVPIDMDLASNLDNPPQGRERLSEPRDKSEPNVFDTKKVHKDIDENVINIEELNTVNQVANATEDVNTSNNLKEYINESKDAVEAEQIIYDRNSDRNVERDQWEDEKTREFEEDMDEESYYENEQIDEEDNYYEKEQIDESLLYNRDTLQNENTLYSEDDRNFGHTLYNENQPYNEQNNENTLNNQNEYHNIIRNRENKERHIYEDHPLASRIFKSFPRMYPFEDNEISWCVRIEPQDIGLLPMEAWVLGNNSFLLHGYYSYRHLLFARMNDKNGITYILGVPGIYHNREKFMAKMFGFENFKCVKRKEYKTGEFGYWYIPIMLN